MPSKEQNIQYLYLVLTHGGNPTVDWDPICTALQLEKGAATKRWSRLKQAIEKGEKPNNSNHEFLWLMLKHSSRDKPIDWQGIADQCDCTKSACSKRYSRLKIAFEKGEVPPLTPSKSDTSAVGTPKKDPSKAKVKTEDDGEGTPTTTPKRKRTPAKKKTVKQDEGQFRTEAGDDVEEEDTKSKRAKATSKSKPKPKPKNGFRASDHKRETEQAQTVVKSEPVDDDGDVFFDAPEQAAANDVAADVEDEILPASTFSEAFIHTREIVNELLNRKTGLSKEHCGKIEGLLDVVNEAV